MRPSELTRGEVQKVAEKYVPQESGITDILFDPALGEATIFVKKISEIINDEKIINNIILRIRLENII